MSNQTSATTEIDRRRLLIGAAWATPTIVLATAVPAAAASDDPPQFHIQNPDAVVYTNGGLLQADSLAVNEMNVVNTGGTGIATIRFQIRLGTLGVAGALPLPPAVAGWTGVLDAIDLGGGLGLAATWVYTSNNVIEAGATFPFGSIPSTDILLGRLLADRVVVSITPPDDAAGLTTFTKP